MVDAKKPAIGKFINSAFELTGGVHHLTVLLSILLVPLVLAYAFFVLPAMAIRRAFLSERS